jgi:hypothetical protein
MRLKIILICSIITLIGCAISQALPVNVKVETIGMNEVDGKQFIVVYFTGKVPAPVAKNPGNYIVFENGLPENSMEPYYINIPDTAADSTDLVRLYFKFSGGKAYKFKTKGDYPECVYEKPVKDQQSQEIVDTTGLIKFDSEIIILADIKLNVRPDENFKNFSLDYSANDSWGEAWPYQFEGTVTTRPDSLYSYLSINQQVRANLRKNDYLPLFGSVKLESDQKFNSADLFAGLGIATWVYGSRSLPVIKLLGARDFPVRNARAYLGFEGGGVYKKGCRPSNDWRFNGELAWRIPVLSSNSYISLLARGWMLTGGKANTKDWQAEGHIKMDIEYTLGNLYGITVNYENGSLPPDFVQKRSVSFGFKISPEFKKAAEE